MSIQGLIISLSIRQMILSLPHMLPVQRYLQRRRSRLPFTEVRFLASLFNSYDGSHERVDVGFNTSLLGEKACLGLWASRSRQAVKVIAL